MDEVEFLDFLRSRDVGRDERVHERLEVWTPPLGESVTDLPFIIDALTRKLIADRGETFVQTSLETGDFFLLGLKVVTRPKRFTPKSAQPFLFHYPSKTLDSYSLKKAFAI